MKFRDRALHAGTTLRPSRTSGASAGSGESVTRLLLAIGSLSRQLLHRLSTHQPRCVYLRITVHHCNTTCQRQIDPALPEMFNFPHQQSTQLQRQGRVAHSHSLQPRRSPQLTSTQLVNAWLLAGCIRELERSTGSSCGITAKGPQGGWCNRQGLEGPLCGVVKRMAA